MNILPRNDRGPWHGPFAPREEKRESERGISLVITFLALMILSILAAGVIFLTQNEMWASYNYRMYTQARYVAEAGQQSLINWLLVGYTPPSSLASYDITKNPVQYNSAPVVLSGLAGQAANYPDPTVQNAFNFSFNNASLSTTGLQGTYSASATLLRMQQVTVAYTMAQAMLQTWKLTTVGSAAGMQNVKVQLVSTVERTSSPLFNFAVFATSGICPSISMSGSSSTDSYDSSLGSYPAGQQNSGGNIGTNGAVSLGGGSQILGSVSLVNVSLGTCASNATLNNSSSATPAYQGAVALGTPAAFPNPPAITSPASLSCPIPTASYSVNTTLAPGAYGNVSMGSSKILTLNPGVYTFNSLALSGGNTTVVVSPPGPVVLQIAGVGCPTPPSPVVDMSGGAVVNPNNGDSSDFQIVYGGTQPITISGGAGAAAVLYAPNAPVSTNGNAPWSGAIVCSTFTDAGGTPVHFDRSLLTRYAVVGSYKVLSFSQSKF